MSHDRKVGTWRVISKQLFLQEPVASPSFLKLAKSQALELAIGHCFTACDAAACEFCVAHNMYLLSRRHQYVLMLLKGENKWCCCDAAANWMHARKRLALSCVNECDRWPLSEGTHSLVRQGDDLFRGFGSAGLTVMARLGTRDA